MVATKIFPVTLTERLDLGNRLVRLPASWEEYLDLLEEAEHTIEYANEEIIFMSIATNPHEAIVINISGILYALFGDNDNFFYASSNRHVFIPEFEADYAPDAHVVRGRPQEHTLRKGLTANLNPAIVFEVLSPSTRDHDLDEKLSRYKRIGSVEQIIYLEQGEPCVMTWQRVGQSNRWENEDFTDMEQEFQVAGEAVMVRDFYKKVLFGVPSLAK